MAKYFLRFIKPFSQGLFSSEAMSGCLYDWCILKSMWSINFKTFLSPCIILLQALRPHGERVTAVKQSPNLSLIATGSSDKTIFIFNKQQKGLSPIGFVQASGSVIDFIWRDDKTILAWCSNHTGKGYSRKTSIIRRKVCGGGSVLMNRDIAAWVTLISLSNYITQFWSNRYFSFI